jgi:hypothetical protein
MSAPIIGGRWQTELRALRPDWDNEQAPKIGEAAISTVERFATVPCFHGGIQLEIHQDGWDIEIEILVDGRIKSVLVTQEPKPLFIEQPIYKDGKWFIMPKPSEEGTVSLTPMYPQP